MASTTKTSVFLPGTLFKSPIDLVFQTARGPTELLLSDAPYWKLDVKRINNNSRAIIFGNLNYGKLNVFNFEITKDGHPRLYQDVSRDLTISNITINSGVFMTIILKIDLIGGNIYISVDNLIFYVPFDDFSMSNMIITCMKFGNDNRDMSSISRLCIENCIVGNINMDNGNPDLEIPNWRDIGPSTFGLQSIE